ncbi:hypothetical protein EDC01DRAFT_636275 [Geopyxis carbonaria]|nr:hypothetical protein EDC01DRAFT_636275 [Geopyxis carbonaria]
MSSVPSITMSSQYDKDRHTVKSEVPTLEELEQRVIDLSYDSNDEEDLDFISGEFTKFELEARRANAVPLSAQDKADLQYLRKNPPEKLLQRSPPRIGEFTVPEVAPLVKHGMTLEELAAIYRAQQLQQHRQPKYHAPSVYAMEDQSVAAAQHFGKYNEDITELFQLCINRHFDLIKTPKMAVRGPPQIAHKLLRHEMRAFMARVNRRIKSQLEEECRVEPRKKPTKMDKIMFTSALSLANEPEDVMSRDIVERCLEFFRLEKTKRAQRAIPQPVESDIWRAYN